MTNKFKITNLIIFLIALIGLNYGLTQKLEIPTGDKSLWFHSGLLLLVFGSYWSEYFFTKPSDVVINGLVVFISASALNNPPLLEWWNLLRYYALIITVIAFLVTWHGSPSTPGVTAGVFKKIIYRLVITLGSAKIIFTLTFFLSVISYFGMQAEETKWLLAFWTFVIVTKEMELDSLVKIIFNLFNRAEKNPIGLTSYFKQPGIAKFKLLNKAECPVGSIVAFTKSNKIDSNTPIGIVTTSHISPAETECEAVLIKNNFLNGSINQATSVVQVDKLSIEKFLLENLIYKKIKFLLGYAAKLTNIGTLRFGLIKRAEVEEGHLVELTVEKNKNVLFQLVEGQHKEELTLADSERKFTEATAEQIGTWNNEKQCFETYSWVVPENSLVFHVTKEHDVKKSSAKDILDVGYVPNSNFPANINLTDLNLYHSAILGVTGSGKSYLSYHLVESLAESGIKILCLDVTGDHKRYLKNAVQIKMPSHVGSFLNAPSKEIGIIEFSDSRTHPIDATKNIADIAYEWCLNNRKVEEIKKPIPKVLIVLEEAHTLIPEWNFGDRNKQDTVAKISQTVLQARKYGLGFMIITQRTANVTKSILNQCNTIFSFQAYDETGFDFLKNYMGEKYVKALPNLKQRHGILVGKASLSDRPLIVRFHDQDRQLNNQIKDFSPAMEEIKSNLEKKFGE